jgi:hypothetical protein
MLKALQINPHKNNQTMRIIGLMKKKEGSTSAPLLNGDSPAAEESDHNV